jgi:hypothetical protein
MKNFLHLSVKFFLLGPNILHSTFFSQTPSNSIIPLGRKYKFRTQLEQTTDEI